MEPNFTVEGELGSDTTDAAVLDIKRSAADWGVALAEQASGGKGVTTVCMERKTK